MLVKFQARICQVQQVYFFAMPLVKPAKHFQVFSGSWQAYNDPLHWAEGRKFNKTWLQRGSLIFQKANLRKE